ncbi:metacaspase-1-like isoform X1 [Camellia sinensis]|uniref:metacaspase-1-like isoform X1 n=1 Tax=Camellia sinensis TaxID=4442 RepID=UPI0010368E1B|nr:metacaspase-1-like isoform X1 [Camellia sinensis]
MFMLVNCSHCHTPLQLPPGARSIRCAICQAITHLADPRTIPPPPSSEFPPPSELPSPPPPPSPYNHTPPGPPPSAHGRKKAVICGISYKYSRHELKGCINDAKCMKFLLINKFQFPEASVLMLTEEETDPYRIPTKQNMRMALYWLVQGCQPGDSLLFHYSGHGSRQRNISGDEVDGYDETLCPLDFETQGMIVDDEINATIVRPLPYGVKLHAIIDACHSGTVLDLPFLCRMNRMGQYVWEDHRPQSGVWKGTNGGEVISFSGCDDDQTSADTAALSKITSTGAMTFCFIQAIERGHATTYGSVLNSMRTAIRSVGNDVGGGVATSLLSMLLTGGSVSGGGLRQFACMPAWKNGLPLSPLLGVV